MHPFSGAISLFLLLKKQKLWYNNKLDDVF